MKTIMLVAALALLGVSLAAADDAPPLTLRQIEIPREEIHQQALLDLLEFRYAYEFKTPPDNTFLFAECFVDGQLVRRFRLAYAAHSKRPERAKGSISLGWLPRFRELAVVNDNGFSNGREWTSRVTLPLEVMAGSPWAVYSEKPIAESRALLPDYPGEVSVYPLIALIGKSDNMGQSLIRSLSTTKDFLREAAADRVRQCVIVYLYPTAGGDPHLHFDNTPTR